MSNEQSNPEKDINNPIDPPKKINKIPATANNNGPSYFWIYLALILVIGFTFYSNYFEQANVTEISRIKFDNLYRSGDVDKIITSNGERAFVYIKKEALKKEEFQKIKKNQTTINQGEQPVYFFRIYSNAGLDKHIKEVRDRYQLEDLTMVPKTETNGFMSILSMILPALVFVGLWYLVMRRMGGGGGGFPGGGIFSIGKSKAALFDENSLDQITFEQVAGLDEEKVEVMEIVNFLKDPGKYTKLGGKIPKGALLVGPPGTGKTLLAKAMAGEAKVPFFSISGSDFVEMFVGVGASRVRDLFRQAREKAPCIVFIDEIDAVGRSRNKGMMGGGNDERESTLNQLLVEMDGFGSDKAIIMLAATNRPEILDDALLRPGRFDRQIHIDRPDLKGREQIFNVHLKPIKTGTDVDAQKLSELTPGMVGADIANICNEAALVAARKNKEEVNMQDFNDAIDRVTTGLEKKNMIISPEEKKSIAYHEAGHALTSWYLEHAHPFIRVTIIPRSESLGHALYLPKEKYLTIKEELADRICVSLGGRAAEKIIFNQISTGALSDLDHVTQIAYSMVTVYGMSEKVGNVSFYRMAQQSYEKPYSAETSRLIDEEVRAIIDEQYQRAIDLLNSKKSELDLLAKELLEKEVLHKDDLIKLFGKRPWDEEREKEVAHHEAPSDDTLLPNEVTSEEDALK
jgi:cell division protease FtsH